MTEILLAGPTASGKSALAMELAERVGGTIVNTDALQVYRDLRLITARPSVADEARVPHALYGHVAADEGYSVGRWAEEAGAVLAELRRAGRPAIFTGGTGLYFKALTEGLAKVPPIPPEVREKWRLAVREQGAEALHKHLAAVDPEGAAAVRPSDQTRIVRAIEVIEATGIPLREWHRKDVSAPLVGAEAKRFVVEIDRAQLAERVGARFDAMVGEGVIEEVAALLQMKLDPALPIMKAVGVRELATLIAGKASLEEATSRAKLATLQYAKRQMTWFRNQIGGWPRVEAGNIRKASEVLAAING
jgi:tRNA dimethylallyltransferase